MILDPRGLNWILKPEFRAFLQRMADYGAALRVDALALLEEGKENADPPTERNRRAAASWVAIVCNTRTVVESLHAIVPSLEAGPDEAGPATVAVPYL